MNAMKAIFAAALAAATVAACSSASTDYFPDYFPRTTQCPYPGAAAECRGLYPG